VPLHHTLKPTLKRGALIAAANWPVTVIQAVTDSIFKLLIPAPLIGGVFLVALVVGSEPVELLQLERRELVATILTALPSRPIVLSAFLAALGVVVIGGSLFVFLVKAGTVSTLVRAERAAGPIEQPPLHLDAVLRADAFSIETFSDATRTFFPRYARLGAVLMAVYVASGGLLLAAIFGGDRIGWGTTAGFTLAFVLWITIVNLFYLLLQIVIAADDCSVGTAAVRVAAFVRRDWRHVGTVFLAVLAIVIVAQMASVLAAGALSLLGFVPFFGPLLGVALLPLSLLALGLRLLVFQYIGLSSVVAYLTLYRDGIQMHAGLPRRSAEGLDLSRQNAEGADLSRRSAEGA